MIERVAVVAEARAWVGTRFAHQGRVKGAGVDCVGLLVGVMRELGAVADDVAGYARQPDGVTFQTELAARLTTITEAEAGPGDVVSIAFAAHPMHVAILGDYPHGLSIIHALMRSRAVVEHRLDELWRSRIVGWHRLPGVA